MSFDYKKEYKEFYLPKNRPEIINIPRMNFIAVRGRGNPNDDKGEYQAAIGLLYGVAFTIKMSYKTQRQIEGYFSYVVPPLEGLWWMEGIDGIDYSHKENFNWISIIRLPDFVNKGDFDWAICSASEKKKLDFSGVEFFTYNEKLCVQCMHHGSYNNEPQTIRLMNEYLKTNGYKTDITDSRYHHEIYLNDARRCAPDKLRTVIRHPVIKIKED